VDGERDVEHVGDGDSLVSRLVAAARREGGFTMVELLASMIVLGILFSAFSIVFSSTIHNNAQVEGQTLFQTEARAALDRLVRDLRQSSTGDSSTARIAAMSGSTLTFYTPDSATPYHLREISYRVAGGELDRQIATSTNTGGPPWTMGAFSPWSKQVGSITNTTAFTYLDANGAVTTAPASVQSIAVSLTLATIVAASRQFTYSTSVTLRTAS
jgi:prepilin-type N-terminal cleavage/methylation domain-containing protein